METRYEKVNDYTLAAIEETVTRDISYSDEVPVKYHRCLTRQFNFAACQIRTTIENFSSQTRNKESGSSSSMTSALHIQNFDEVQSQAEIEFMYAKLKKLKGNPPPLPSKLSKGSLDA